MLAESLPFPDLRHGTNEYFRGSIDLPCSANATRYSCGENGNSTCQARNLRSADFAPDQRLACSDQDRHFGRLAQEDVERQRKGEYLAWSGENGSSGKIEEIG